MGFCLKEGLTGCSRPRLSSTPNSSCQSDRFHQEAYVFPQFSCASAVKAQGVPIDAGQHHDLTLRIPCQLCSSCLNLKLLIFSHGVIHHGGHAALLTSVHDLACRKCWMKASLG